MRAAGHGLLHMQGLPVAIVLAAVAFLAQVAPDVLDGGHSLRVRADRRAASADRQGSAHPSSQMYRTSSALSWP